ncbi:MAG: chromosomal replication initiator DnaA [Roseobacter sp.]|jgi:chromosomal replication initiation ATPase DnaA|nr:chromosomal replication initiator DnaA [Roseobacter sp.]
MSRQLGFDLPGLTALNRADFLVAPSNAVAVAMIENWHDWPGRKLVLCGPEGSGKTHLSHVWAQLSGARIVSACDVREPEIPDLAHGSVAVEDVPEIAGQDKAQTALFHLHNLVLAEGHSLLMTGCGATKQWGLDLPDLASRIEGTPAATLALPDDALLAAVIAKLFADRQITPKANLIPYLIPRINRSFAAAGEIVAALDTASLAEKRPVNRRLAADVLDKLHRVAR